MDFNPTRDKFIVIGKTPFIDIQGFPTKEEAEDYAKTQAKVRSKELKQTYQGMSTEDAQEMSRFYFPPDWTVLEVKSIHIARIGEYKVEHPSAD